MRFVFAWVFWVSVVYGLIACSAPERRFAIEAEDLGFRRKLVNGTDFSHVVYEKGIPANSLDLHIYIDGDGRPWIRHRWVSRNPTPSSPLILRLMNLDPVPAIYLGRPCYHGQSENWPCTPLLWTHERYSEQVVSSLVAAMEAILKENQPCRLVLIGYSGGGTLAMLLAERLSNTHAIVTIAGNLNVSGWAKLHGYSPLLGSLDPSIRPPLPRDIFQLHLAAENDRNIPPDLIQPIVARQSNSEFLVYDEFDHLCCWESVWPSILAKLKASAGGCSGFNSKSIP